MVDEEKYTIAILNIVFTSHNDLNKLCNDKIHNINLYNSRNVKFLHEAW